MTWFRVDDKMMSHPKVLGIPRAHRLAVIGLWTSAGVWCAGQLTDGFVPAYMLAELGGSKRQAQALVDCGGPDRAGLWEERPDGWQFHDWQDYQPTREHVENERSKARERMTKLRRGSGDVRANTKRSSESVRDPRPDPTRPDPALPSEVLSPLAALGPPEGSTKPAKAPAAARGTNLPDGWMPPAADVEWARAEFPELTTDDLRAMHDEFADYWRGVPGARGRKVDWPATWRNRIRDQAPRRLRGRSNPRGGDIDWQEAERMARQIDEARAVTSGAGAR